MVCVRGVNIYPTAIEAVVRAVREVVEYRATIKQNGELAVLSVEIEVGPADPETITTVIKSKLREALGLSVQVRAVASGTLPRFEMKSQRFIVDKNG